MPVLAPAFREINRHRMNTLREAGFSLQTIASVISDETQLAVKLTVSDVRSYFKVQEAASVQMLISQRTMRALLNSPSGEPKPE